MGLPTLTDEQIREAFDLLEKHGTKAEAARVLGISRNAFRNRISKGIRRGYSPNHDMTHISPDSFLVKGVSSLYDKDGQLKQQWVKTQRDAEEQQAALEAAVLAFKDEIPPLKSCPYPPYIF